MKKAGIDFGLTNVKAYWKGDDGQALCLSTAEMRREDMAELLVRAGVTDLCAAGNGRTDGFEGFTQHRLEGSPLETEIRTQAVGARHLIAPQWTPERPHPLPDMYYLVSIGTGTSYAVCDDDGRFAPLLGSAVGAGTVDGLLAVGGQPSGPHIDALLGEKLARGDLSSYDLPLVEAVPAVKDTPLERYVASHLAKMPRDLPSGAKEFAELLCMSAVNLLVTDVARSLLLHDRNPDCRLFLDGFPANVADVAIIGAMPHRSKVVRMMLDAALRSIGKRPIFPEHGEYALAVGAYHSIRIEP